MIDRRISRLAAFCAAGVLFLSPARATGGSSSKTGLVAFDYAFRFATAIQKDPKDQAKAQEAVLQDLLLRGEQGEVISRVEQIQGWRRGVVYADSAAAAAKAGRAEEARRLLGRAEEVRAGTSGWEGPRIGAHIASALAQLGEIQPASQITQELDAADPRQYTGRSAWTLALGHASKGEFSPAMEALRPLDGDGDLDVAAWRTKGYVALGRESRFTESQRLEALDAAMTSSANLSGWSQAEANQEIAQAFRTLGRNDRARQALEMAEKAALSLPDAMAERIPVLAELARSWGEAGDPARGRELLRRVEPAAAQALDIDRPAAYARLASVRHDLGDESAARRLYGEAFRAAESLVNARPRALAVVDICRSLGREGIDPDVKTKSRLDSLLGGLRDPW